MSQRGFYCGVKQQQYRLKHNMCKNKKKKKQHTKAARKNIFIQWEKNGFEIFNYCDNVY